MSGASSRGEDYSRGWSRDVAMMSRGLEARRGMITIEGSRRVAARTHRLTHACTAPSYSISYTTEAKQKTISNSIKRGTCRPKPRVEAVRRRLLRADCSQWPSSGAQACCSSHVDQQQAARQQLASSARASGLFLEWHQQLRHRFGDGDREDVRALKVAAELEDAEGSARLPRHSANGRRLAAASAASGGSDSRRRQQQRLPLRAETAPR